MRSLLLASAASLLAVGTALAQPATQVAAPGTVVVHMHGYFNFGYGAYGASTGMSGPNAAPGKTPTGYKLNDNGTFGDFRLLPGFDAQTINGIWYGAQVELRTTLSNAGEGKNNNSTNGSGFSSLYIQRAYGYIGTPTYGFARFGQTDSAFTLSQTGVIENFGDGQQFNCDGSTCILSPVSFSPVVFADTSHLYTTSKIVYESPAFETGAGKFSGIIGFEPNSNGIKQGYASVNSINGANADSVQGGSAKRRRNTLDVSATYANDLDGFANQVSVSYLHGSPLGNTSGAQQYAGMSVFQAGAQTSYAGLTIGANLKAGAVEDGYTFKPKGARNTFGYIVGASYDIGPYNIGANYFNEQSAGTYSPGVNARTLSEYGVAVGGAYKLAKPISLYLQYEYGHQHQPSGNSSGNIQTQIVAVGTTLKW